MTDLQPQRDDEQLIEALGDLFDHVTPNNRDDCDDELRDVGIDPATIAHETEQLAARFGVATARTSATHSRSIGRPAVAWALAAAFLLCLGTWLIVQTGDAGRVPPFLRHLRGAVPQLPSDRHVDSSSVAIDAMSDAQPQITPTVINRGQQEGEIENELSVPAAPTMAYRESIIPPVASTGVGETVHADNIDEYAAALSPGIQWAVRHGMRLRVVATQSVQAPRAYREATQRYSTNVYLGSDGLMMENYIAGLPFPHIDPNDPHVANKIMWNYAHNFFATDDMEASNIHADSGSIRANGSGMLIEQQFSIGQLRRLFYTGRLFADPKPNRPSQEAIRYREALSLTTEAIDLRGLGVSSTRYESAQREDDTWLFLPVQRRVRRLAATQRSDALFGDADPDSFFGFSGHFATTEFRFLGEGSVLASMHAEHTPVRWGQGGADFAFDDVWEIRPVYVIEALPRSPQYAYGSRILYVDKEAWVIPFADMYDRSGELWKAWINMYSVRANGNAANAADDGDRLTLPASVVVDVQHEQATRIAIVGDSTNESGWRFNQGDRAFTEDWFSIANLIARGSPTAE